MLEFVCHFCDICVVCVSSPNRTVEAAWHARRRVNLAGDAHLMNYKDFLANLCLKVKGSISYAHGQSLKAQLTKNTKFKKVPVKM